MKKDWVRFWGILGIMVFCLAFWAGAIACFAEIDIDPEARPAITETAIDTVRILPFTETAEINIRRGYIDGEETVWIKERNFIFMNREDNPDTPEDETCTDYTLFISTIDADMAALRNLIKSRW